MIRLYKGIDLNRGDHLHIFASNHEDFITYLGNEYYQIAEDKYTFNGGAVRIRCDTISNDMSGYTYAVITRGEVSEGNYPFFRCYHIDNIVVQSDMLLLYISVDAWGSYISRTTLSRANVRKCNRKLGVGTFDEITPINYPSPYGRTLASYEDFYVVVSLRYNINESLFSNNVSASSLCAFSIKEVYDAYYDVNGEYYEANRPFKNPLTCVLDVISGLYGVSEWSLGPTATPLNAELLGAWVVHKSQISIGSSKDFDYMLWFKTIMVGSYGACIFRPYKISNCSVVNTRTLTLSSNVVNNQIYLGTYGKAVKLPRLAGNVISALKTTYNYDKINVELLIGDRLEDITDAFEVELTTNDGNVTGLRALKKTIRLLGVGTGIANAIATQNYPQIITSLGGLEMGGSIKSAGEGDGLITFLYPEATAQNLKLYHPLCTWSLPSAVDEVTKAIMYGANFDIFYADLMSVFNYELFETTFSQTMDGATYVQADVVVEGAPTSASNYITIELSRGVRTIKCETNTTATSVV